MTIITILFTIVIVIFALIYHISKRKYDYWEKLNVPYLKPTLFLGNYGEYILMKKYIGIPGQKICQQFPDAPYIGSFYGTEPALLIQDPDLIQLITTKDFYYFSSREISKYTHNEVFTQNLFFTYGDRWKVVRQHLTPLFTSAKMKNMFYLIEKCANSFENLLETEVSASSVLEARSLTARYTIDVVCLSGFGIDANTMGNLQNNPFSFMAKAIFDSSNVRGFKLVVRAMWPAIFYKLGFKTFPLVIYKFFNQLLKGVFEGRNYQPSTKNDFVDLVLNLKKDNYITGDSLESMKASGEKKKINIEVDEELLLAQCIMFFAAGFETTASVLCFTLYEIAKKEEVQKLVIEEVDKYLREHEGKFSYESMSELPYLEACFYEALRLYPALGLVTREVVEDYTLPSGLRLEKGMRIHLPVYHLHRRPDFFPEPEEFRPERFLGEEKNKINPYIYMPFGEGPRICIGRRFGMLMLLPALVTLFKKYHLELAEGTPRVLELEPRAIVTQSLDRVRLKFVRRQL